MFSRYTAIVTSVLLFATSGLFIIPETGCIPPVSDETEVKITGRVLNEDGTPAAGQEVKLWKSDVPLFDSHLIVGIMIDTGNPFRTRTTDADGTFSFVLPGDQVNSGNQRWAAYFAVTVSKGNGDLAVATYDFHFSNQKLTEDLPDMQFWDAGSVEEQGGELQFSWEASPTVPSGSRYHLAVAKGTWFGASSQNSMNLSTLVLEPGADTHHFQLISLGDQLRYRTSLHAFSAQNPIGEGLDYKQPELNNVSALDCVGNNLFEINDGVFDGQEHIEYFNQSANDGAKCLEITLAEATVIGDMLVQNASVYGLDNAQVDIFYRDVIDGDWVLLDSQSGRQTDFNTYNIHLSGLDINVRQLKLEVVGGDNDYFDYIGEITLYAL